PAPPRATPHHTERAADSPHASPSPLSPTIRNVELTSSLSLPLPSARAAQSCEETTARPHAERPDTTTSPSPALRNAHPLRQVSDPAHTARQSAPPPSRDVRTASHPLRRPSPHCPETVRPSGDPSPCPETCRPVRRPVMLSGDRAHPRPDTRASCPGT